MTRQVLTVLYPSIDIFRIILYLLQIDLACAFQEKDAFIISFNKESISQLGYANSHFFCIKYFYQKYEPFSV
jgi:hypothetical protein